MDTRFLSNLTEIRDKIDEIDDTIISLIRARKALSTEAAALKTTHNLPVYDGEREYDIFAKYAALGPVGRMVATALLTRH